MSESHTHSPDDQQPRAATAVEMAASFASSIAEWIASGLKVVPQDRHDARLAACNGCKYHQAPRCQLCGCFTDKKAWMPHEDCPVGKWPG